jgi:hypothetical protein
MDTYNYTGKQICIHICIHAYTHTCIHTCIHWHMVLTSSHCLEWIAFMQRSPLLLRSCWCIYGWRSVFSIYFHGNEPVSPLVHHVDEPAGLSTRVCCCMCTLRCHCQHEQWLQVLLCTRIRACTATAMFPWRLLSIWVNLFNMLLLSFVFVRIYVFLLVSMHTFAFAHLNVHWCASVRMLRTLVSRCVCQRLVLVCICAYVYVYVCVNAHMIVSLLFVSVPLYVYLYVLYIGVHFFV